MIWNALEPNRETATHVKVDGVEQMLFNLEIESNIDGASVSSIYGSINVETVKCEVQGDVSGVELDVSFELNTVIRHYSKFVIEECVYDDKSDKTSILAHTDISLLESEIVILNSLDTNVLISNNIGIGETVILPTTSYTINSFDDKYYQRKMDLFQDIACITGTYVNVRKDELGIHYEFKGFTPTNHNVKPFELTQGSTMAPVDQIDMTWNYGDNVSIGSGDSLLRLENIELIKDYREELLPSIFNNLSGLGYNEYEIEYAGDPFIKIGDIIQSTDKDGYVHDVYITSKKFKDNGAWGGNLSSHIVDAEEVETNYVGTYDKAIKETNIRVDKVTGEIIIKVQENTNDIADDRTQLGQISVKVDEIEQIVSNIDTTSNIEANANGFNGYKGYTWVNSGGLKWVSGLTWAEGLRWSTTWESLPYDGEAIKKQSFFTSGDSIGQKSPVTGDEDYSYSGRVVGGTQVFQVLFREYNSLDGAMTRESSKSIGGANEKYSFTLKLLPATKYLQRVIRTSGNVTPSNRLEITEQMVNKGQPGEFQFQIAEFVNKTEAKITVLEDEVTQAVNQVGIFEGELVTINNSITVNAQGIAQKVDKNGVVAQINLSVDKINQARVDITGLVTVSSLSSSGQTVINGDNITTGKIKAQYINFDNAKGNNVDLTGKITATSGSFTGSIYAGSGNIGGLSLTSNAIVFPNNKLKLSSGTNAIEFGSMRMKQAIYNGVAGESVDTMEFSSGLGSGKGNIGVWGSASFIDVNAIYAGSIGDLLGVGPQIFNSIMFDPRINFTGTGKTHFITRRSDGVLIAA